MNPDTWCYVGSTFVNENPEYLSVTLDSSNKVIEGVQNNGMKYLGAGMNIGGNEYYVVENPEWIRAVIDSDYKILCGIKQNGKFYADLDGIDEQVKELINPLMDKVEELVDRFDEIFKLVENPEFLSVELDSEEKVLGGRKIDGIKFENVGLDLGGGLIKGMDDPEGRIEIKTDFDEKIISYRKEDGTLVENVGIESKNVNTDILNLPAPGIKKLKEDLNINNTFLTKYHLPKFGYLDIISENFYLTYDSRVSSKDDVYVIQDLDDTDANARSKRTIAFYYIKSTLTDNGDGTYSKNASSIKLDFYASSKVTKVSGNYYVTSSLTEIIDPVTGDITYEVNDNSIKVVQITDVPDVRTWPVDKKTEHNCIVNINFGHYYTNTNIAVKIKFQGSSTLEYRKRNFRFTFYKNTSFAKKDKLKIGELIRQSAFNLKANWTDSSRVKELILNRLIIDVWSQRDTADQYPWNKEYTPYTGATGTIKGFPVKVSIGGNFYGLDIFGLKKDEKNYLLDKAEVDGDEFIDATGMFVSGNGGPWIGDAYQDSWQVRPEYWEDEMNDDEFLTEILPDARGDFQNKHTVADFNALVEFLTFVNSDDFSKDTVPERMSVIDWIDYYILMQVFVMYDNTSRNMILYSDSNRKKIYPFMYDLDLAWRPEHTFRVHIDSDVLTPVLVSNSADMTVWIKFCDLYKDEIINRYCQLRNSVLTAEHIETIYEDIVESIPRNVVSEEAARWGMVITTYDISSQMKFLKDRLEYLDNNYFKI